MPTYQRFEDLPVWKEAIRLAEGCEDMNAPDVSVDFNVDETRATVVIDHRELPSGMKAVLESLPGVSVRVETMRDGDYSIDGLLLVERKTVADLAVSILDTRLFRQASNLLRQPTPAVYIIEGTGRDLAKTQLSREALQGALITLMLIYRFPVLRSSDKDESARLMLYAARQLARRGNNVPPLNHRKPKSNQTRKLHLLRTLPGIGNDRARRLLATFGSIEKCLAATAEELAAVEGIGRKTAERIRNVVEEEASPYLPAGAASSKRSVNG